MPNDAVRPDAPAALPSSTPQITRETQRTVETTRDLPANAPARRVGAAESERTTYHGWSCEIAGPESSLTNEILLYAYPIKAPEPPPEYEPSADRDGPQQTASAADDVSRTRFYGLAPTATEGWVDCVQTPRVESGQRSARDTVENPTTRGAAADLETEINVREQERLNVEELQELCAPLEIDTRCNLCAIISICSKHDNDKRWLLDYSVLCYKCNFAPRTPLSVLIVATEFAHLLKIYFKNINFDDIFKKKIITIFDFHMHFFINRCFSEQSGDHITNENITLNHISVVRSLLLREDSVPYTRYKRLTAKRAEGPANKRKADPDKTAISLLEQHGHISDDRFTNLLFYIWSGTNVFFNTTLTDIAILKYRRLSALNQRATEIERSVGPIYLSFTPIFTIKNLTTPVCLLCELMACSYKDNVLLAELRDKVIKYCHNNVKIIDRIQLTLAELLSQRNVPAAMRNRNRDVSRYVLQNAPSDAPRGTIDDHTYIILKQVGVTGIYKHFFCDPQCAANIRCTRPEILFRKINSEYTYEVKLSICCENNYISQIDRKVWLYAQLFKAFQITKRNFKAKTQLADFLKDFNQLLQSHDIHLVDPAFIVDKYV
ncbi:B52 [miniopterid betaherpesvirus 1]|uniref:Packaging protein UL32 n=1 Tax=miniopterid betaherpesvirus 1 TaxID=3070189 RepID=I3VQ39_9BETA|nr:B52 [miniopterid betaherpesvirus 1]AFK83883.1 B52 [miniopterid betaherpesvirus 1]